MHGKNTITFQNVKNHDTSFIRIEQLLNYRFRQNVANESNYGYMKEKQVLYAYFELWHDKNYTELYLDISYNFHGSGIISAADKNIIIKFIEQINV